MISPPRMRCSYTTTPRRGIRSLTRHREGVARIKTLRKCEMFWHIFLAYGHREGVDSLTKNQRLLGHREGVENSCLLGKSQRLTAAFVP